MKLTSVEIHPAGSSDFIALSFRNPIPINAGKVQDSYAIKTITGLDADEIVPRYYTTAGNSKFYNMSLEGRVVVLKVGLNPSNALEETYSSLRDRLYKTIATSRTGEVQLQFKNNDLVLAVLSGFIVKMEATLFEKTQEIIITLIPSQPMLEGPEPIPTVAIASGSGGGFVIADNVSTAPHGFSFLINITGAGSRFSFENTGDSSVFFSVSPVGGFLIGDMFHFSNEHGRKILYLVRSSTTIQLMDRVDAGSIWPILFPGENHFTYTGTANPISTDPTTYVSFYPTFWGI